MTSKLTKILGTLGLVGATAGIYQLLPDTPAKEQLYRDVAKIFNGPLEIAFTGLACLTAGVIVHNYKKIPQTRYEGEAKQKI